MIPNDDETEESVDSDGDGVGDNAMIFIQMMQQKVVMKQKMIQKMHFQALESSLPCRW